MNKPSNHRFGPDPRIVAENRSNWPLEELVKVGDQWVAWSEDHSRMVAHHADFKTLTEMVLNAGISSDDVVLEWIPPKGEWTTILGGQFLDAASA